MCDENLLIIASLCCSQQKRGGKNRKRTTPLISHHTHKKKLINVEIEAREFGFEWSDTEMILAQAVSECNEITPNLNSKS